MRAASTLMLLHVGMVSGQACSNTCASAYAVNDGICDDGGSGSLFSMCPLGSDCNDCGTRYAFTPPNDNSCFRYSINNGVCNDGPNGMCDCGTDFSDCGYRMSSYDCNNNNGSPPPPPPPPPSPPSPLEHCDAQTCDDNNAGAEDMLTTKADRLCEWGAEMQASDSSDPSVSKMSDCGCGISSASYRGIKTCSAWLRVQRQSCIKLRYCGSSDSPAIIGGAIAGGIVVTIAAIILCTISCSLKCYGIVVLVLACLTLVVNLVSISTVGGIPAEAVTIVASVLAIPGSSIIACGGCKRPDGQPPIAAGILCLLSCLLRFVALVISLALSPASLFTPGLGLLIAAAGFLCIVLIVASGLTELILCIKCLRSQCAAGACCSPLSEIGATSQGGQVPTGEIEVVVSPAGTQMVSEAGVEIAMVQAAEAGTSHEPLTKVNSSVFHKRAAAEADAAVFLAEEARKAVEAKTGAGAADVADVAGAAGSIPGASLAEDGSGTQRAPAPQSLAALLTACGLEHRAKNFEDEAYTLETLLSSVKQGEEIAKGDLRELKLTLGECRRLLNHLSAHEMTRDVSFTLRRNLADL